MRTTVIEKKPDSMNPEHFNSALQKRLSEIQGDLEASVNLTGFSPSGWAQVDINGPDEEIVTELISKRIGLAPLQMSKIELYGQYEGIIEDASRDSLNVDIGIQSPTAVPLRIPIHNLRAQLADGQNLSPSAICQYYCLAPGVRVAVRTTRVERNLLEGAFSDSQIDRLSRWVELGLDRIIATNCLRHHAERALSKLSLERDVVEVESLTLSTQSFLCKLGTDAVGLIPRLGKALGRVQLFPFIPKRIRSKCRKWP